MSQLTPLILLVVLLVVFWLVVLRPARNQQRTQAALQRSLAVGDEVVLSAGMFGTIRELDDARVHLEIAPGTVVQVARQVVVRRVDDAETTAPFAATTDDAVTPAADEPEVVEATAVEPTLEEPVKAPAKRTPAKKAPAKRTTAKKAPAKKAPAKKATAEKTAAPAAASDEPTDAVGTTDATEPADPTDPVHAAEVADRPVDDGAGAAPGPDTDGDAVTLDKPDEAQDADRR